MGDLGNGQYYGLNAIFPDFFEDHTMTPSPMNGMPANSRSMT
jgi:hypothetical protein